MDTVTQPQPRADAGPARAVRPYDFQRHEALERGRLRKLNPLLEVMAHRMAGALTTMLRTSTRVEIGSMEQQRWELFANDLPEPTFLTSASVTPFGGRIVLHLPLAASFTLVELRLGGSGSGPHPERAMTEIEQRLVGEVAASALAEVPPAFAPVLPFSVGVTSSVTSSMFLQGAKPTEMCLVLGLLVGIGDLASIEAQLCIPLAVLLPVIDAVERLESAEVPHELDSTRTELRNRLLEVPIEVSVSFPEVYLSPEELLTLDAGDVVRLQHEEGAPLVLRAGSVPFCHVVPTSRGKRLACMVVETNEEERS